MYEAELWTDTFYLDFPMHICSAILFWKEQHTALLQPEDALLWCKNYLYGLKTRENLKKKN